MTPDQASWRSTIKFRTPPSDDVPYRRPYAEAVADCLEQRSPCDLSIFGRCRRRVYGRRFPLSDTRQEPGRGGQQRWGEVRSKCAF